VNISNIVASSRKVYGINKLQRGDIQYEDRLYQFNYVPDELKRCLHIKTCGDDKLISEDEECMRFEIDASADIYVLYPDKQPILPKWLQSYEQTRMKVTRMDSISDNLKGYFCLFRKTYLKGTVILYGCSPNAMLDEDWYVESMGANYCMYSVCIKPTDC
jgi:hypothetical protein